MTHVVPILCLIFFIGFIELQLKSKIFYIEQEFENLKKNIKNNSNKIDKNREDIFKNHENISKLNKKYE